MSRPLLTVAPSPHIHTELTVPQVMRGVLIALAPAFAVSVYNFGVGAVYVTALAVVFCAGAEWLIVRYLLARKSTLADGSAVITGVLLAFNVPTNLPWHVLLIGSVVAVGIGKMSFGGLGNNPFNPALVGRVFLLLSFPVEMTSWPQPGVWWPDGSTGATALGILKDGLRAGEAVPALMQQMPSYPDLFFGLQGGSAGEMSAAALLLGLAYMLYRRIITWHIPVVMMATVAVLSGVFWLIDPARYASPLFHLLTGGVVIGAAFMATDYVTSPVSHRGMVVFAVGCGAITVIIRLFGAYPEGVSFAILIMNAFVPLINTYLKPARYGRG
jgi:electron transport complex protein RnfD